MPILGIRSLRCLHTCWRGRSRRPIFDHRETVMGLCRLARTVCERVGERWRDGVGSLPNLGYPVTKMLAHMLARAVEAADFRPSRNGDGTVPAGAHSLRAYRGAIVRRHGQFADLGPSGRTVLVQGGCDPTLDCRETAMGPARNSHLETLRRTQTVGDCPKRTAVSEAYPCTTSTCHTPLAMVARGTRATNLDP
jgi:hypothetical protein